MIFGKAATKTGPLAAGFHSRAFRPVLVAALPLWVIRGQSPFVFIRLLWWLHRFGCGLPRCVLCGFTVFVFSVENAFLAT